MIQRRRVDRVGRSIEYAGEAFERALGVELLWRVGSADRIERQRQGAEEKRHEQQREDGKGPERSRTRCD